MSQVRKVEMGILDYKVSLRLLSALDLFWLAGNLKKLSVMRTIVRKKVPQQPLTLFRMACGSQIVGENRNSYT